MMTELPFYILWCWPLAYYSYVWFAIILVLITLSAIYLRRKYISGKKKLVGYYLKTIGVTYLSNLTYSVAVAIASTTLSTPYTSQFNLQFEQYASLPDFLVVLFIAIVVSALAFVAYKFFVFRKKPLQIIIVSTIISVPWIAFIPALPC